MTFLPVRPIDSLKLRLSEHIRVSPMDMTDEVLIHMEIVIALMRMQVNFQQEYRYDDRDRLDFLLEDGTALEVKKGTAGIADMRQVGRYLEHPGVTGCIVIAKKCVGIPHTFLGKPVVTIELWRKLL